MARLTYSVAIKLLADNFQRGVRSVKSGLSSLQANIVTLASAIGALDVSVSGFLSGVVSMTRETTKAATVMRNVSASAAEYSDNMRWAAELSKRYGAYVNDVVRGFAKFRGAAGQANMSLDDQRALFESVTRACTAFALSADETNGVFLALTQMIGKGKVQAEELRGQLGERMPIAMQAMAKAAGTTVAGLDALMKQGKLTADILPAFGKALDEMLPNVQTDTVEAAFADLRNAAKEFSDTLDLGGMMKSGARAMAEAVRGAAGEIGNIVVATVAVIAAAVGRGATRVWQNLMTTAKGIEATAATSQKRLEAITASRIAKEQQLERLRIRMATATSSQLVSLKAREAKLILQIDELMTAEAAAQSRARQAQAMAETVSTTTAWGRVRSAFIVGAARVKAAFASMWAAWGPGIIIGAIVGIIGKFVSLRRELEEINRRLTDFRANVAAAGKGSAIHIEVQGYVDIASDQTKDTASRLTAAALAAQKMGVSAQGDGESDTDFIARVTGNDFAQWSKGQQATARREVSAQGASEALARINERRAELGLAPIDGSGSSMDLWQANDEYQNALRERHNSRNLFSQMWNASDTGKKGQGNAKDTEIVIEARRVLTSTTDIEDVIQPDTDTPAPKAGGGEPDTTKAARDTYEQSLREIAARYQTGAITEAQRAKETDELRLTTRQRIMADTEATAADRALADELAAMPREYTAQVQAAERLGGVMQDYTATLAELDNQRTAGVITEREYWQGIADAADAAAKQAAAIDPTADALDDYKDALSKASGKVKELTPEHRKQERDVDPLVAAYGQETVDAAGKLSGGRKFLQAQKDVADLARKIEDMKSAGMEVGSGLVESLDKAIAKAKELETALKLDTLKRGISTMMSAPQSLVGGIDGVVSAVENLQETMSDDDATGWDKFRAGFDIFMSIGQAITSTIQAVQSFQQVLAMFTAFQKTTAASGAAAEVAASSAVTAAKTTETAANTGAAVSGVFSAHSAIPFVGVAMAAAMIGTMLGLILSSRRKAEQFAAGGIVGGSTATGDQVAASLNAGEMVLNKRQQRNLFAMLDGRAGGARHGSTSRRGVMQIRGEDLYTALDNYQRRTGKTLR